MQVVLVPGHGDHLGNDGLLRPLRPELLHQLLQVVGGGLADREHVVNQPRHAQAATEKIFFKNILMKVPRLASPVQLLVEELYPELAGQQRHVLDNSQPHPPLGVLTAE